MRRRPSSGSLDEYFESRPHLLGGGGGGAAAPVSRSTPSPTAYTSAPAAPAAPPRSPPPGRTLPPWPAHLHTYLLRRRVRPPANQQHRAKPDMATRMVMSGMKLGPIRRTEGAGYAGKERPSNGCAREEGHRRDGAVVGAETTTRVQMARKPEAVAQTHRRRLPLRPAKRAEESPGWSQAK